MLKIRIQTPIFQLSFLLYPTAWRNHLQRLFQLKNIHGTIKPSSSPMKQNRVRQELPKIELENTELRGAVWTCTIMAFVEESKHTFYMPL